MTLNLHLEWIPTYVLSSFTFTTFPKVPSPRVARILSNNNRILEYKKYWDWVLHTSVSLVLYDVAQLVWEMTVFVVLNRTDLGSHSVLGCCSSSVRPKIVRLLVVWLPPGVGSKGSTPPLGVPSSSWSDQSLDNLILEASGQFTSCSPCAPAYAGPVWWLGGWYSYGRQAVYGESFLSASHPVAPSQLVRRVDPLEREVLSLVLSQTPHACQAAPTCCHVIHKQEITHQTELGCLRTMLSSEGIWRPCLGLLRIGGIWSWLLSLLGPVGIWRPWQCLCSGPSPGLQWIEYIWSWPLSRQLLGGSSCSRTLPHSSPVRRCSLQTL